MSSDVESQDGELPTSPEDDLRELEEAYAALRDESQQLINERTTLEAEVRTLRKRIERLDENVNLLKMPPLIVGHLQDVLDHERAIVRSSNGTVFQVSLNQRLDPESLKPGTTRCIKSRQFIGHRSVARGMGPNGEWCRNGGKTDHFLRGCCWPRRAS